MSEYSARESAAKREEWRKVKHEQLLSLKTQTIAVFNTSQIVGESIGAAAATAIGGAVNLAKGVTAGVIGTIQKISNENREDKKRSIQDGEIKGRKLTARDFAGAGHCLACFPGGYRGSYAHLRDGDCLKRPDPELIPIPDDEDLLEPEEPSFHSTLSKGKTINAESEAEASAMQSLAVREGPAADTIKGIEDKGSTLPQFLSIGIQTLQNSTTNLEEDVIPQILDKLDHITKTLYESDKKLEDSNKKVQILTRRVSDLEAAIEVWNGYDREEKNEGDAPEDEEELEEYADFHQELSNELEAQVLAEVEGHNCLKGDARNVETNPLLERIISPGEQQGAPTPLTGARYPLGTTGDNYTVPTVISGTSPPGLMPLQETRYGGVLPRTVGFEDGRAPGIMNSNGRNFDDVMSFFNGGGQPVNRSDQPAQRGYATPTTDLAGFVPTGRFGQIVPADFRGGGSPTAGRPSFDAPIQADHASRVATSDASTPLSNGDLGMILKLLQQIVGEFPTIILRGMAERPEDMRKWRYAVLTSLKAAGPIVESWWKWCVSSADLTHRLYVQSPIMTREGITVAHRTPTKWLQLESWIRPKLIACLPDNLKKQLTARGMQDIEDECQDIIYLLTKSCMPGAADEKSAVLKMLQDPTPCSKAESALAEVQRFWSAGRRCRELGMSAPDVTVLYTAFRSIFSNVLAAANSNLQLRWMNLENDLGLPHVITIEKMYRVAEFVDGELSFLITQGTKSNNPGLPLTDNQKRQETQTKETEKKRAASAKASADATAKSAAESAQNFYIGDSPKAAAGFIPRKDTSTTHSIWAAPCHDWEKGECKRGISCNFKHEGVKFSEGKCFICGVTDHTSKECVAPGGQKDPKKDEHWAAYKKKKDENSTDKGKGKSKGKGKKGDSKGKGDKGKTVRSARASAVVTSTFPVGGIGLDSWANVFLKHVEPSEIQCNSSMKLAHGECECELSTGTKGLPTSKVPMRENKENIDLLPLGWLWSRGCDYTWNEHGPSIKTPKGRYLQVLMWGLLPYISEESSAKLLVDLPDAKEQGRVQDTTDPQVSGARASRNTVNLDHLKGELEHADILKQKTKYRVLPEVYYGGEEGRYVKPNNLESWVGELKDKEFNVKKKPMFSLWEWYSGSGTLTKVAANGGVSHLPPIDYRYGWSLANASHQMCLLYVLLIVGVESLFAAPNCFPWGRDSRAQPEEVRRKKRCAEKGNLKFLAVVCFLQILLGRGYFIESPRGSDIYDAEESPLHHLQTLGFFQRHIDQCMKGARLEGQAILKSTTIQSCNKLQEDIKCDRNHTHLPLRGSGPGGSRTAQSAKYPEELCQAYVSEMVPDASAGGRIVDCSGFQSEKVQTTKIDFRKSCNQALNVLKKIAKEKGLTEQWNNIVEPWWLESGLLDSPQVAASATMATKSETRAASGLTDVFETIKGDVEESPWQKMKFDKNNKNWQAAGQRRHMHRRHGNQSVGVASVDLSGPHVATPVPGKRSLTTSRAYYFLVLSIKMAPEEVSVPVGQPASQPADGEEALPQEEPAEVFVKPILYATLLEKKSDATKAIQSLLAQIKSEFGDLPKTMLYRLHSDMGGEFLGKELQAYLLFHAIQHTTTQGYDPSSNGAAEVGVGLLKKGARFLLSGLRMPTDWWGVAILAAAHLYRVEAGYATRPTIAFGTRVMVNLDPPPRDAFLPRAFPAQVFGPAEGVPGGFWVYQGARITAKCNVTVEGLTEAELLVVRATWGEHEAPIAPLPPPDASLYDATAVVFPKPPLAVTLSSATCEACKNQREGQPINISHTERWGECSLAATPPQPMSALLLKEEDPDWPQEDVMPEERPNPVLVRPAELVENLEVPPELVSSMPTASRITQNHNKHLDAVQILLQHPHAAIAMSEESSISWLSQISSSGENKSEGEMATSPLETDSHLEELDEPPPLVDSDSEDESDVHIIGNVGPDDETDDSGNDALDFGGSLDKLFKPPKRRLQKKVRNRINKLKQKLIQSDSVSKALFCRAAAAMMGAEGEYSEIPDVAIHGLALESDMLLEPDSRTVQNAEVRGAVGKEAEGWRGAIEKEYVDNFVQRNVFTVTTEDERRKYGMPLPMKLVFTMKKYVFKCRAVVCGNFEKNPCEQLWTAQAEVASLIAAVRLAINRNWLIGAVDVSGAFMYAPLPENMLVVVQPPKFFVEIGLAKTGELWTLCRAVYGLKISPKAWGLCRDKEFRKLTWTVVSELFLLVQCSSDTQVWKIVNQKDPSSLLGLIVVYVDDFLILCPAGAMREGLIVALRTVWTLRPEVTLGPGSDLTFLGLEFVHKPNGVQIGQRKFTEILLEKHKFPAEGGGKSIPSISMDPPGGIDIPTPEDLKKLQGLAGEFNWLATRSRADLAYFVSLLSSALTKFSTWSFSLSKKILRYLQGTRDTCIFLPSSGDLGDLTAWSDAGFAGISTKSQTGMLLMWGGAILLWRSSRQTVPALSTAEAELIAASMTWQVLAGVRAFLEELGIVFQHVCIKVDNTAAITIATDGSNWRTRYFSVRGSRINHEILCGTLKLEHEPTLKMLADALTKLGTKNMLENIRNAMIGIKVS